MINWSPVGNSYVGKIFGKAKQNIGWEKYTLMKGNVYFY